MTVYSDFVWNVSAKCLSENLIRNFHYQKTIRLLKKEATLKSCYPQNNFKEIWFFPYKQTNNITGSSDWVQNVPQKLILNLQSKGLQLYLNGTPSLLFSCDFSENLRNNFSVENLWSVASKIHWLPVKKSLGDKHMIYDKHWKNLHLHLFRQAMHNRTWRSRSCCPFTERVVDSSGGSTPSREKRLPIKTFNS